MALTVMLLSFTLFLLLGIPVIFSIGLCSLATAVVAGLPLGVIFQKMVGGMQVFSFLAIPFFIFAGELMLHGGIADKIVNFAKASVGHVRGGLGMANVVACTLFGGISGSAGADVSAMGAVLIPTMKKEGYDTDYAVNVTTHSALVGVLTPTSLNIIIFTLAANGKVSVLELILACILPAIVLTLCNLGAAYYVARKRGYPKGSWQGWNIVLRTLGSAAPGLFVVVLILGGILSGVFTATESAAIAVAYSLVLTALVYRSLSWDKFVESCAKSVKTTGVVLALIGISATFGYFLTYFAVPELVGELMSSISSSPWIIFLLVNIALFVLGTFLDMAPTILVCTPIFMPICQQFGMEPAQFAVVMLLNCALGLNTPPVGTTQFIGCAIGGISVGEVMKSILPFYGSLIVAMLLITYVPALSLWLPSLAAQGF